MKKCTLASIVAAVSIAGGALAVSQVDSSRFRNAIDTIAFSNHVDLGKRVSREQLRTALLNAAYDRGYGINFNEVYEKGYRLGSVEETSDYQCTKAKVSIGPMQGIDFTILGDLSRVGLTVKPSGLVSDEEIRQYLNTLSSYLSQQ